MLKLGRLLYQLRMFSSNYNSREVLTDYHHTPFGKFYFSGIFQALINFYFIFAFQNLMFKELHRLVLGIKYGFQLYVKKSIKEVNEKNLHIT